jgi:[ribosomal protein S18]-alanine N-acetyltransferase
VNQRKFAALYRWGFDLIDSEPRIAHAGKDRLHSCRPLRMSWTGVVSQRRRMDRNYDLHVLTLAQVATLLRVEGSWPDPITLTSGWLKARARPWNEAITDPMVRLERGGTEFLVAVTQSLYDLGVDSIYSPALYPGSTRVWKRAGFGDHAVLKVMERSLGTRPPEPDPGGVGVEDDPDWEEVLELDRLAFTGFWGMSRLGLEEAHRTNKSTVLLTTRTARHLSGYCIVGAQWGTVYLHRIAVRPGEAGHGLGARLVAAAIDWGASTGSQSIVLNVRPENTRAKRLYDRLGFASTRTALEVLRHDGG